VRSIGVARRRFNSFVALHHFPAPSHLDENASIGNDVSFEGRNFLCCLRKNNGRVGV
jgi:hypothetical protein